MDEEQINNMSYVFFEDILEELGHKLSYDAIINYAGNSFCEKSWDMIQDANPMLRDSGSKMSNRQAQTFVDFFSKAKTIEPGSYKVPVAAGKG